MDEFELIRRYFVRPDEATGVTTGIGDDGAILRPEPGRELVVVIDTLVADVHFPASIDPFDIGYRAVAVNLSDVAAMGGRPRWMTLALTLPAAEDSWLDRFAAGLHAAGAEHGVALVGGDTTYGKTLVISVQITGDVPAGKALLRTGAQVGDHIYVTGTVGDAAAGLALLRSGTPDPHLAQRFLRPAARVACGQALLGVATAAIDLSDGLYADLRKLLAASGRGGVLQLERLPYSAELCARFDPAACRDFGLSGGDDYELCFTAASPDLQAIDGVRITRIGAVTNNPELICHLQGELVPYADSGYRHFQ